MQHSFLVKFDCRRLARGRASSAASACAARPAGSGHSATAVRRGQLTLVFVPDSEGLARLRMVSVGETRGDAVECWPARGRRRGGDDAAARAW